MTLIVYLISKHDEFNSDELAALIPEPHNDLFGFEILRKSLWGHPVMLTLGCTMIHGLSQQNIYAFDEDVFLLKHELLLILNNLGLVSCETKYEEEFIRFRIENALEVTKIAENYLCKVGVAIG
jgi:hypothetical protein